MSSIYLRGFKQTGSHQIVPDRTNYAVNKTTGAVVRVQRDSDCNIIRLGKPASRRDRHRELARALNRCYNRQKSCGGKPHSLRCDTPKTHRPATAVA